MRSVLILLLVDEVRGDGIFGLKLPSLRLGRSRSRFLPSPNTRDAFPSPTESVANDSRRGDLIADNAIAPATNNTDSGSSGRWPDFLPWSRRMQPTRSKQEAPKNHHLPFQEHGSKVGARQGASEKFAWKWVPWESAMPSAADAKVGTQVQKTEKPVARWFWEKPEAQAQQEKPTIQTVWPWQKPESLKDNPEKQEKQIQMPWVKAKTQGRLPKNPIANWFQEQFHAPDKPATVNPWDIKEWELWQPFLPKPTPPKENVLQQKVFRAARDCVRAARDCGAAAQESWERAGRIIGFGCDRSSRTMQGMIKRWQTENELKKIQKSLRRSQDLKKALEEANEIFRQNRKRGLEDTQLRNIEHKLIKSFLSESCDEIRANIFSKNKTLRQRVNLQKELRSANNVLAILQANINSLRQTKDALAVDANYFKAVEEELKILQGLIQDCQREESSFRTDLGERLASVDKNMAKLEQEHLVEENRSRIHACLEELHTIRNQVQEMLPMLDRWKVITEALDVNVGTRLRDLQNATVKQERVEAYEKALGEWRFWQKVGYTKWQFWLIYRLQPRIVGAKQALADRSREIERQLEGLTVEKETGIKEEKRKSSVANPRVNAQAKSLPLLNRRTDIDSKGVGSKRIAILKYGSGGLVAGLGTGVTIGVLLASKEKAVVKE